MCDVDCSVCMRVATVGAALNLPCLSATGAVGPPWLPRVPWLETMLKQCCKKPPESGGSTPKANLVEAKAAPARSATSRPGTEEAREHDLGSNLLSKVVSGSQWVCKCAARPTSVGATQRNQENASTVSAPDRPRVPQSAPGCAQSAQSVQGRPLYAFVILCLRPFYAVGKQKTAVLLRTSCADYGGTCRGIGHCQKSSA